MKQIKMWVMFVSFLAITAITLIGCMKESLLTKETTNQDDAVQMHPLSVFYNGNPIESVESVYANRNRDADMELISIVDTTAIRFFDMDSAFFNYCTAQEMQLLYETNSKFESIYAKAVALNLIDSTPSTSSCFEMETYWYSIFNSSITADTSNTFRTCLAIQAYDSEQIGGWGLDWIYFALCRAELYEMDRIISSYRIWYNAGWVVWCKKRWFGGQKTFCSGMGREGYKDYSLAGDPDNNTYRSFFRILP